MGRVLYSFLNLLYINLLEQIRDYKTHLILLAVPVLLLLLYGFTDMVSDEESSDTSVRIALSMESDSIYEGLLRSSFFEREGFGGLIEVVDVAKGQQVEAMAQGYHAYIDVPDNFFDALMYFEHAPVVATINTQSPTVAYLIDGTMASYGGFIVSVEAGVRSLYEVMIQMGYEREALDAYNEALALESMSLLLARDRIVATEALDVAGQGSIAQYYGSAVIVVFLLMTSLFIGVKWLETDHHQLLVRYSIVGRPMDLYVAAWYMAASIYLLLVLLFWIIIWALFMPQVIVYVTPQLLGLMWLYLCFCLSLVILVASLLKDKNRLIVVGGALTMVSALIGGGTIPIQDMPQLLRMVAGLTPVYWMIRMMLMVMEGAIGMTLYLGVFMLMFLTLVMNRMTASLILNRKLMGGDA